MRKLLLGLLMLLFLVPQAFAASYTFNNSKFVGGSGDWNVFSMGCWANRNGAGGSGLGFLFTATSSFIGRIYNNEGTTSYNFGWDIGGVIGDWKWARPATGVLRHEFVTYDGTVNTNDPIVYVDGQSVAVTDVTQPALAHPNTSDTFTVGNLADVLGWDGDGSSCVFYSGVLPPNIVKMIVQFGGTAYPSGRIIELPLGAYLGKNIANPADNFTLTAGSGSANINPANGPKMSVCQTCGLTGLD